MSYNGLRLWIINCKRRSVVVFYRMKPGNTSKSLGNWENPSSGWSDFRHTGTHVHRMRSRLTSHSSFLSDITHPSEWNQALRYPHSIHGVVSWNDTLLRAKKLCAFHSKQRHYSANYSQKMIPILSHTNPDYNVPVYFYKINLNNIVSAKPISLKWYHSFRFPFRKPVEVLKGLKVKLKSSVWRFI
jgi:hypothetical protein